MPEQRCAIETSTTPLELQPCAWCGRGPESFGTDVPLILWDQADPDRAARLHAEPCMQDALRARALHLVVRPGAGPTRYPEAR